jgi:hypothetical protein
VNFTFFGESVSTVIDAVHVPVCVYLLVYSFSAAQAATRWRVLAIVLYSYRLTVQSLPCWLSSHALISAFCTVFCCVHPGFACISLLILSSDWK